MGEPVMRRSLVAIVGRPNVGKSTLFNRLAGGFDKRLGRQRRAIVEDMPGVTRDRQYANARLRTNEADRDVVIVDTGGFLPNDKDVHSMTRLVRYQAQAAVEECDAVLWVVDARTGITAADEEVSRYLRKVHKPVILLVNKVDDMRKSEEWRAEFFRLGVGEPIAISAEHALGIGDLCERLFTVLPAQPEPVELQSDEERPIRLSIVGRPNVGKSTLLNALLKEERSVVSDVAGTTRDPVDAELEWHDQKFILTDTAGIRRKATIAQKVEQFSVLTSLRVIEESDVAVLVLDANEAAVDQDARIAGIAEEKGRALLVVINKWDTVKDKTNEEAFRAELKYQLPWVSYAPVIFVSAKLKQKVEKVLEVALHLQKQWTFRAPTPRLNKLIEHITTEHPLPFSHGKALKIYYCAQVAAAPPTFQFVCNQPTGIPERYKRYVINQLRAAFDLRVPIRLLFKERPGKEKRAEKGREFKSREAKVRAKGKRPSIKRREAD